MYDRQEPKLNYLAQLLAILNTKFIEIPSLVNELKFTVEEACDLIMASFYALSAQNS
jgi:hypothetical protein